MVDQQVNFLTVAPCVPSTQTCPQWSGKKELPGGGWPLGVMTDDGHRLCLAYSLLTSVSRCVQF